jgi:hypothetical protein
MMPLLIGGVILAVGVILWRELPQLKRSMNADRT